MFAGMLVIQTGRYNDYRLELDRVLTDLLSEQQNYAQLQEQIIYYESDAYIEQLARDQLGFVKPDEIVFINMAD